MNIRLTILLHFRTIICELAQLVVDSLLHALQDLRYMELAQGGASRCGAWIEDAMLKHLTI
ncbi:hypothetical protein Hanom_Chr02g00097861 [Helianthus anomalus]